MYWHASPVPVGRDKSDKHVAMSSRAPTSQFSVPSSELLSPPPSPQFERAPEQLYGSFVHWSNVVLMKSVLSKQQASG